MYLLLALFLKDRGWLSCGAHHVAGARFNSDAAGQFGL